MVTGVNFFIDPEKVIEVTEPLGIVQLKITTPPFPAPPAVDVDPVLFPFVEELPLYPPPPPPLPKVTPSLAAALDENVQAVETVQPV